VGVGCLGRSAPFFGDHIRHVRSYAGAARPVTCFGKKVVVNFDGGLLSSDGGVLALREIEQRLRVAERMAACLKDPRDPGQITHPLDDIIRFRLLMIAAGYEDGNDANTLRSDPMFKMALDLAPSERELCSQPTISRLENLPDARALLRMGHALIDLYCESFHKVPDRIILDIDDTFDAVHGGQQLLSCGIDMRHLAHIDANG
jgi:hypothetical protein